jgi:hypothetical protein
MRAFPAWCLNLVFLWCAAAGGHAALPAYYFADFETAGGWTVGDLPRVGAPLRLMQGEARVIALPETDSAQALEVGPSSPFPAVFVDASPIARSETVFAEVLARPLAVADTADEEFLDFGGAVLGFFRVGDLGEVRALFGRSAEEGVWISTGVRFPLDAEGLAASWLRIDVRLDRSSARWNLAINGQPRLAGLRTATALSESRGLALWLYGHGAGRSCFDDVLLSTVEADQLEKMIAWQHRRRAAAAATAAGVVASKKVTNARIAREFRQQSPALRDVPRVAPVLHDWHLSLTTGEQTYSNNSQKSSPTSSSTHRITAHGLSYDDQGKVRPGVVTITADAELRPGTDLGLLGWRIAELKKWPDEIGEIVGEGTFETGLVQTFTLSPEWMRKAKLVQIFQRPR